MQKKDKKQFDVILLGLAEFYEKTLSDMSLSIYFEALDDMSLEQVKQAAGLLARTSKFFPKPCEFRDTVLPDLEAQAALAYDKVNNATKSIGAYKSVVFDDPVIHVVLQSLGGWVEVCGRPADTEKEKWWRKEFERLYRLYSGRNDITTLPVLGGISDKENGNKGLPLEPAVEVGDKEKIKALKGDVK